MSPIPTTSPKRNWPEVIILRLMFLASGGLIIWGLVQNLESILIASGILGLILTGTTRILAARSASSPEKSHNPGSPLAPEDRQLLSQLHEHSMLSDNAKRVLFRERELQLIRSAIQNHIAAADYNAALILCDELMNLYGQREEAEQYRTHILQVRQEHYEQQVRAALEQLNGFLQSRDWAAAHQEAARLKRLYPDSPAVEEVDRRIFAAREEYKRDLEQQFLEAAEQDDPTRAMEILRNLDRYLSREEADRLGAIAERVVTRHRELLTDRFKQAVSEHRWAEALTLGDTIMQEFPNSRMADEVRGMMDMLHTRAEPGVPVEE